MFIADSCRLYCNASVHFDNFSLLHSRYRLKRFMFRALLQYLLKYFIDTKRRYNKLFRILNYFGKLSGVCPSSKVFKPGT